MADPSDGLRETLVSSAGAFEGRIIQVRVDTVLMPSGRRTTREVVVHPGAVAIVPLHANGDVSLIRQWRQPAGKVLLEIPAGTLEAGEEPVECARRELMEEIGSRPGHLRHLFSSYLAPGYSSERLHTFLATDLEPARAEADLDEAIESVRVPLAEAAAQVLAGEIEDAKTACGLLLAERWWRENA